LPTGFARARPREATSAARQQCRPIRPCNRNTNFVTYSKAQDLVLIANSGNLDLASSASRSVVLSNANTPVVYISNSGVGIGIVTPSVALEVSGTVSATHFFGDDSGLTGIAASGDRLVSGSVNAVAEQTSGTVRVRGTLALINSGNDPCDDAHAWSLRINQATGFLQMCRPN
jgi:hypothetical protein